MVCHQLTIHFCHAIHSGQSVAFGARQGSLVINSQNLTVKGELRFTGDYESTYLLQIAENVRSHLPSLCLCGCISKSIALCAWLVRWRGKGAHLFTTACVQTSPVDAGRDLIITGQDSLVGRGGDLSIDSGPNVLAPLRIGGQSSGVGTSHGH